MTQTTFANVACAWAVGLFVFAAGPAVAQDAQSSNQRAGISVEPGVHVTTRLNTSQRFYGPVESVDAVRAMMARPGMAADIQAVFESAGIGYLGAEAVRTLTAATALRNVTVPVGSKLEWMALRERGKPAILRNVQWGGTAAFEAYEFSLDDGNRGYTFLVPTVCANIALASTGPSPRAAEAARAAELKRAEDAKRAAADEAAARKAEEARKVDEARKAEDARRAEAARMAEAARKAEEARAAEAARQAAEAAERDRRAKVDAFIEILGGKERRLRAADVNGVTVENGQCAALVGGKGGLDLRLGSSGWRVAPGIGVAVNTEETGNSSLFGDVELNYWGRSEKGFVGTGVGVWDVTHSDTITGSWLLHGGVQLARTASDVRFLLVGEGRLFFDHADDIDNNYMVWAGLRVVFR